MFSRELYQSNDQMNTHYHLLTVTSNKNAVFALDF